jgi:hypothetical protein
MATKHSSPYNSSPNRSLSVPLLPTTQVSISRQINIIFPTPTTDTYYHQGVSHIIGKQQVWHWTCEFDINNLHLQVKDMNSTST